MPKKQQKSTRPDGWLAAGLRVPLELTFRQVAYARRAAGVARFVQNIATAIHRFHRHNRMKWPSTPEMERAFNAAKREDYPFVTEVSKFVAQGAFRDFENGIKRWRDPSLKSGAPQFKRKKRTGEGGFLAASGIACVKYDGHRRMKLPFLGSVKMSRKLPADIIPYEVRISFRNGQWTASIAYWKPPIPAPNRETQTVGGVDVGISPLAMDSDGNEYQNPKAYEALLRRRRRWQRAQARRTPGSRGWHEAQHRLDRINRRIVGLRNNAHHQLSRWLVRTYHTLGIETLNVRGMIAAGLQPRALTDAAIGGLLHKIRYKAEWYGTRLVQASQWYPSSKTCSDCGEVNAALGREAQWACPACGVIHDRNLNAARNLLKLAIEALRAVGPDVTLGDGEALAGAVMPAGETAPREPRTEPIPAVNQQLALAL